ncbi:hypothetical protein H4CHR_02963 [Variovorax sp. PBS-H4]|nr:hypothetical protein H4CHR_02963 [Variovorax sp. PBS-H4]
MSVTVPLTGTLFMMWDAGGGLQASKTPASFFKTFAQCTSL